MSKKIIILVLALVIILFAGFLVYSNINKAEAETDETEESFPFLATVQGQALLPISPIPQTEIKVVRKINVITTAYSSTICQTDSTPFITASGTYVKDGIVANNLLPFGTKIRIPEIYGEKIFVVEDRMNKKKGYYHVDVWFSSYWEAKCFGAKNTYIEIIEEV